MSDKQIPPSPSRKDYTENEVYKAQAEANSADIFSCGDPLELFKKWAGEARQSEANDSNAMSLATLDAHGFPDVRIVLLKSFDEDGFVFYSNANSAKGQQLETHAKAAICLHWKSLRRQIRVQGAVTPVSDQESDAYFASRAREAQIGAWASQQSEDLESREIFEAQIETLTQKYEGRDVPRPPHWRGWRICPIKVEFWRDRPYRLHDRLVFKWDKKREDWTKHRLYP